MNEICVKSIDLEEINRIKKFNTFRDYRKFIKRVEEAKDERFYFVFG